MAHNIFLTFFIIVAVFFIGISGTRHYINRYPYLVVILVKDHFRCNGVLISRQIVLTTVKCVEYPEDVNLFTVKTGRESSNPIETHEVLSKQMYIQKESNPSVTPRTKIMLSAGALILKAPITINENQMPINITEISENDLNIHAKLVGAGVHDETYVINGQKIVLEIKDEIDIELYHKKHCENVFATEVYDYRLCGFVKIPENCFIISSAPLIYNNGLIGISTYTNISCKPGYTIGFTSTTDLKPFIDSILR
ncbi:uncharacterized protein [Prorops nasuta]|uniref:uncharacterized protein n=1 Tax=Prorops nasuta TaxID=863751 RepID=UPI0034CF9E04